MVWGVCGLGFTSICMFLDLLTHTIHGTGIFTYMLIDVYGFHIGKYTISPMDATGCLVVGKNTTLVGPKIPPHLCHSSALFQQGPG